MNLFTKLRIIGPIGLCVLTAGATVTAATPEDTASPPEETAAPPQQGEQQGAPGMSDLVGDALANANLSDEQRAAVDEMGKQVTAKEKDVADARDAFLGALTEQLASGKIDEGALKDPIDALVNARSEGSKVLRKALVDVHGILDQAQRARFNDMIQARMKEVADASALMSAAFVRNLALAEEQTKQMNEAFVRTNARIQAESARASAAFAGFGAGQLAFERIAPTYQVGDRTRAMAQEMITLATQLGDILTPEQRARVARRIGHKVAPVAPKEAPNGKEQVGTTEQGIIGGLGWGGVGLGGVGLGGVGLGRVGWGGILGMGGLGMGGLGMGGLGWGAGVPGWGVGVPGFGGWGGNYAMRYGVATGAPFGLGFGNTIPFGGLGYGFAAGSPFFGSYAPVIW